MSHTTPTLDSGKAPAERRSRLTPGRVTIAAATVPSVLSLAWSVWSIADMIPGPWYVGIAPGLVLDLAVVAAVAIAWNSPSHTRMATVVGWTVAAIAAVAVGMHSWSIAPAVALLGVVPLVAKALWHLALTDRARRAAQEEDVQRQEVEAAQAEERRAAEFSEDLTDDQRRDLAKRRRDLAYRQELAEIEQAEAAQEHAERLADIERRGTEELAEARTEHTVALEIIRHDRAVGYRQGAGFALPAVPNDASSISDPEPPAGFGAALAQVRTMSPTPIGTPADQQVPRVPTPGAHHATAEAQRNRQTVLTALKDFENEGRQVSISALAKATGLSRRTVTRHLPTPPTTS